MGAETRLVRERVGRTWILTGRGDWQAVGGEREGGNEANAWIPASGWGATINCLRWGHREEGLRQKILNSGLLGDVLG